MSDQFRQFDAIAPGLPVPADLRGGGAAGKTMLRRSHPAPPADYPAKNTAVIKRSGGIMKAPDHSMKPKKLGILIP
ncbi:hypothetical protein Rvan_2025 [Rhodomicrobium vannielii ATCC 17100]|uniref:Uncharacterized protein n=1 Tax=Rhodomicrobium vannielii (strain ATCC 17100 / DSM 162 / LMG 4299 / NCIMB 10020 / ATH 3.1.1) TaxID=648757 RepID=E3I1G9_RHOVT|nr:hypothetical protein Rvan_2025 [Rhodomicrobium vannielii ATCC 17100]